MNNDCKSNFSDNEKAEYEDFKKRLNKNLEIWNNVPNYELYRKNNSLWNKLGRKIKRILKRESK